MGTKAQELAEKLQALTVRLEEAEQSTANLREQLQESRRTISKLQEEKAEAGETSQQLERKLRAAKLRAEELDAELKAKAQTVDQLNEELDGLSPKRIEALRQQAEESRLDFEAEKAALERKQNRRILNVAAIVVAGLTVTVFIVMFFFNKTVPRILWGLPVLLGILTWGAAHIRDTAETAWPHLRNWWRPISIVICLFVGGTIATIGLPLDDFTGILQWILVTIVYGAFLHALVEMGRMLFVVDPEGESTRGVIIAYAMIALMGGIIIATLNPWFDLPKSPANALLYMVPCILIAGIVAGIGLALMFLAKLLLPKFMGSFADLFRKEVKRQRLAEGTTRYAKAFVAVIAVIVGCIVASSFWNEEPGFMMRALPIAAGFSLMVLYFLTESQVITACARAYGKAKRARAWRYLAFGVLVALFTVPMSFGKVFEISSSRARFADMRAEVVRAENLYFSTVKPTVDMFREEEESKQKQREYDNITSEMQTAITLAEQAESREDLKFSVERFRAAGSNVTHLLPPKLQKENPLLDVKVPPSPIPIELVMHLLGVKDIEGLNDRYVGAGVIAGVLTCVLDLVVPILGFFFLLTRWRKEEDEMVGVGQIGTIREGGRRCLVIVDDLPTGMDLDDTLNVLGEHGAISTLLVEKPDGDAGFDCKVMNPGPHVRMGLRVTLVNVDADNGHASSPSTPPSDDWDSATPDGDQGPNMDDWAIKDGDQQPPDPDSGADPLGSNP